MGDARKRSDSFDPNQTRNQPELAPYSDGHGPADSHGGKKPGQDASCRDAKRIACERRLPRSTYATPEMGRDVLQPPERDGSCGSAMETQAVETGHVPGNHGVLADTPGIACGRGAVAKRVDRQLEHGPTKDSPWACDQNARETPRRTPGPAPSGDAENHERREKHPRGPVRTQKTVESLALEHGSTWDSCEQKTGLGKGCGVGATTPSIGGCGVARTRLGLGGLLVPPLIERPTTRE